MATVLNVPPVHEARPFYLPELDGLRFCAFLSVFISHLCFFSFPMFAHLGAHGVDLFFTLSAYLLTELMLREKQKLGRLDIKAFYIRRALRIWPLYFTFLLVILVAVLAYPVPGIPRASLATYALFLGDFPLTAPTSFLVVSLWSISMEEQFYLAWPHVMQHITRQSVARTGAILWMLCIVIRWSVLVSGHGLFWLAILSHFDSLACGVTLVGFRPRTCSLLLWLVGASCWILGTVYIYSATPNPFLMTLAFALVAVGCGAFLLGAIGADWLRNSALVYLGRISYGLYVFHGGALLCALAVLNSRGPWIEWIAIPSLTLTMTIAIAATSYRWLESPFLRLKSRFQHVASQPQ